MAQFVFLSGSFFGRGHDDNPTYKITSASGQLPYTIFLSGSGGYVNSPTGITKNTLENVGVNISVSNDFVTRSVVEVESGFSCTGEQAIFDWGDDYEPGAKRAFVSASIINNDTGTNASITYRISVGMDGFNSIQFDVSSSGAVSNYVEFLTRTTDPNSAIGEGTVGVTRLKDSVSDTTADGIYSITVSALPPADFNVANGSDTGNAGDTPSVSATIGNTTPFEKDEYIFVEISEGTA